MRTRRLQVTALALLGAMSQTAAAQPYCDNICRCPTGELTALDEDEHTALQMMTAGAALFVPSYVLSTVYAASLPGGNRIVEATPIVGPIVAAARQRSGGDTSLLLFAASTQTIGVILAVLSTIELRRISTRRYSLAFGVAGTPGSTSVTTSLRW